MTDDALMAWLDGGCKVTVSADEAAAKRASAFSLRFLRAINPDIDLGVDEESHQAAVAMNVFVVHHELNLLGEEEYSAVWRTLDAKTRRAIKAYVEMNNTNNSAKVRGVG